MHSHSFVRAHIWAHHEDPAKRGWATLIAIAAFAFLIVICVLCCCVCCKMCVDVVVWRNALFASARCICAPIVSVLFNCAALYTICYRLLTSAVLTHVPRCLPTAAAEKSKATPLNAPLVPPPATFTLSGTRAEGKNQKFR